MRSDFLVELIELFVRKTLQILFAIPLLESSKVLIYIIILFLDLVVYESVQVSLIANASLKSQEIKT